MTMNNSNNGQLNMLDLPDEILFIILKKLNMVGVLYSLVSVNRRFDELALDSLYIRDLDMTYGMTIDSRCDQIPSVDNQVLSRICGTILCRIHSQIHKLTVEPNSMKKILLAANYPQLYSLSLVNFHEKVLYQYLTDDWIVRDLLTKQITHLNVGIQRSPKIHSETAPKIFELILSLCEKLVDLNFGNMFFTYECWTPIFKRHKWSNFTSSILVNLRTNVATIDDCLLLLDGRLECLSTLIINILRIHDPVININSSRKLPKLKCFSLISIMITAEYDTLIVSLLCRMINLKELSLYLTVLRFDSTYVDGVQLYDQFLIHMMQLNKFTFNINTRVVNTKSKIELPSNEDIQRSFLGRNYSKVASSVHADSIWNEGECRIYSLPFDFDYFIDLDNSFQGGLFHKVRHLTMYDRYPFEHKLFQVISQDFPFLQFLQITNRCPQEDKEDSPTILTFPHLTFLDLEYTHVDYAKLFLVATNAHLPRLFNLHIGYESLRTITDNFTIDATHFNFGKVKSVHPRQSSVRLESFHRYFPVLNIV